MSTKTGYSFAVYGCALASFVAIAVYGLMLGTAAQYLGTVGVTVTGLLTAALKYGPARDSPPRATRSLESRARRQRRSRR